jgi:diguanylate cyclase (GGDEF)-like protein/PAS domain S-box-containing protein
MQRLTRDEVERICIRNLLGAREERIFFKDRDSRFLLVSAGWLAAEGQGRSLQDVIGKTDFDIFSRPHAIAALEDEQRIIRTGEAMIEKVERETFHDRADAWVSTTKLPLLDERGEIIGTFGIARDVSAQMRDWLTGLANRVALMDRLTQAILALERQAGKVGLLFLDVDHFKSINDTLGHRAGDEVLVKIAQRLSRVARRFDTVARYGGDEFVLLPTALTTAASLESIGERVLAALAADVEVDGHSLTVTASLGGVIVDDATADPNDVVDQADAAMYAAKQAGRSRFEIFRKSGGLGSSASRWASWPRRETPGA